MKIKGKFGLFNPKCPELSKKKKQQNLERFQWEMRENKKLIENKCNFNVKR